MTTHNHLNSKRIAVNTIMLYLRSFITMIIGLFTSRVVLNALGAADYGLYNVVGSVVVLLGFINGSMTSATQRFITFELGKGSRETLENVIACAKRIHLYVGLGIILICETIGLWYLNTNMSIPHGQYFAANIVFQVSIFASFLNIVWVPYLSLIVAYERMSVFAYVSIATSVANLCGAYLIYLFPEDGLIFWAFWVLLVNGSTRVFYTWYCSKWFEESKVKMKRSTPGKMKEMLGFSSWSIVGSLAYRGQVTGTNIVLNYFFGTLINAASGIANQLNGALSAFIDNFLISMNPQIVKTYADGDRDSMHKLIITGSRYALFLTGIFVIPLFFEVPVVLRLWLKNVPDHTVVFARMIFLITIVNAISSILVTSQNATGKVRNYQIVMTLTALTQIPVMIYVFRLKAIPMLAYVVNIVICLVMQLIRLIFVKINVSLSLREFAKKCILPVLAVFMISGMLSMLWYYIIPQNAIILNLMTLLLSFISTILVIYGIGMNKSEKSLVTNKLQTVFVSVKR